MSDELHRAMLALFTRSELADAVYAAVNSTGQLPVYRTLSYRCASRCLLLDIIDTPQGAIVHFPRFSRPPAANDARSSAEGRAANTEDGRNHWRARSAFLDDAGAQIELVCKHAQPLIDTARVRADLEGRRRDRGRHADVILTD